MSSSSEYLLVGLRTGDEAAATAVFDRYVERLIALARARLSSRLAARTDPEDIVLSAYRSFFIGIRDERYILSGSGDMWRLLAEMTLHKLYRNVRKHQASKRSVEREVIGLFGDMEIVGRDPAPSEAAALTEFVESLFASQQPFDRWVLELRLQGHAIEDIATITEKSDRTIRRSLEQVRGWLARNFASDCDASAPGVTASVSARHKPSNSAAISIAVDPRATLPHRRFLLREHIGSGGMGKVYRAWDQELDREVAVKFLRKDLLDNSAAVEQFVREATLLSTISHPGIVAVHGLGQAPHGNYFLVMELLNGPDLAREAQERLPEVDTTMRWVIDACNSIEFLHGLGVIHCDLKPANLFLTSDRQVKVGDFGLARWLSDCASRIPLQAAGTAAFMAPEQVSEGWGKIGPHTDVYGLGAVLFTLLVGRPPYVGERSADILAAVVSSEPVPKTDVMMRRGISTSIARVCETALQKSPGERFSTAAAFGEAIHSALESSDLREPTSEN